MTVLKELIEKSSGAIYKKMVQIFFGNVQDERPLRFVLDMCESMIKERKKVSRCSELILTVKKNDQKKHMEILKILLDEKIEL